MSNSQPTPPQDISESAITDLFKLPQVIEFAKILHDKGMQDETVGFLTGRFARRVGEDLTIEVMETTQELVTQELTQEEVTLKIPEVFKEKTGKTIDQRRVEIAQAQLDDFKSKGGAEMVEQALGSQT